MSSRRYQLQDPELNQSVEDLVERASELYGVEVGAEYVREILVTGLRLLHDGAAPSDIRLTNNALKELRHAFRVFSPYAHHRKVAVFGSSRTEAGSPDWEQARLFAEKIVLAGWMVITGAGSGIMAAAQGGAGREASFGVNIRLPFEQAANEVIADDHKLINFRYFFTRKLIFVKEAHAIALFPGGFGTHDEGNEALTLIQTGKGEILPVVFIDRPGGSYWKDWSAYVNTHFYEEGFISPEDLSLFSVTDDVGTAISEILNFYSNYQSSRWVHDRLVLRVHQAPNDEELDRLNADFKDIVVEGEIEVSEGLPQEGGEMAELPRVVLRCGRGKRGRIRRLIDALNELVPHVSSPPAEASPPEILPEPMPDSAETAEDAED